MEGKSVEDNGEGVLFCVFAYNVQPGVSIDYATGESSADGTIVNDTSAQEETSQSEETQTYVLNTNTHKFHKPGCYSVEKIKPENYAEFTGTREEAIAYGYDPCKTAIHKKMNKIEITDLTLPELQVYTSLNEAQLLHYYEPAPGIFIAESPKVIERALEFGCEPISLLMEQKDFDTCGKNIIAQCKNTPVYTAKLEVLEQNYRI